MASPVYSTQLFQVEAATGGSVFVAAIPSDVVWVLRDVWVVANGASGLSMNAQLTVDTLTFAYVPFPPLCNFAWHWAGRVVAPGGSDIQYFWNGGASDLSNLYISGYVLT